MRQENIINKDEGAVEARGRGGVGGGGAHSADVGALLLAPTLVQGATPAVSCERSAAGTS
jgi:hypothetical protein